MESVIIEFQVSEKIKDMLEFERLAEFLKSYKNPILIFERVKADGN